MTLFLAALLLHAQGSDVHSGSFVSPRGEVRWRGLESRANFVEGTVTLFGTQKTPAVVEDTGSGITLVAKSISCTLVRNANGEYEIREATLRDQAQVLIDSGIAAATARTIAQRTGKPVPEAPRQTTRAQIESDEILYSVTGDEGVLTLPKPVNYTSTTDGSGIEKRNNAPVSFTYHQTAKANGTKGRFTIVAPAANREPEPKTGRLDGPVKFSSVRTVTYSDAPNVPQTTTLTGIGNLFEADFLAPTNPTVTLTGAIRLDIDDRGTKLTQTGEKAIVTLDKTTRQPIGYDFVGDPAKLTIPKQGGGQ